MSRQFKIEKAVRIDVPLLIGLFGASKSGKTNSALRLAKGIQRIVKGPIVFIDTESGRGLHYADDFDYEYIEFPAPFGSLDYLEILKYAASFNPAVTIVDSASHEHEGQGGLLDFQEQELTRLAGNDYNKRNSMKMLAWNKPKQARRTLINGLLQLKGNFIFCFRAKEGSRPVKGENGKMTVENFGFMPICGYEFAFEMTINMFLPPKSEGRPDWHSDHKGEKLMMGLPEQFKYLFPKPDVQIDEDMGEKMAKWAKGDSKPVKTEKPAKKPVDLPVCIELEKLSRYLETGKIQDKQVTIGKETVNLLEKAKGAIKYLKGLTIEFKAGVQGYKPITQIIKLIEAEPEELDVSREKDQEPKSEPVKEPVSEQDELDIF